ncbi:GTP-binding protein rho1 [Hesseltinella vesiculosa]|uniref:GTP-binding protein rho1 n=1 Tax=Hesseltinella vesiculosa TaxID=101127 RepID=A0A1X2G7M4_9FUNG|nr:GTP-binding protein rho1 [Hesseltinella vesiculosa]
MSTGGLRRKLVVVGDGGCGKTSLLTMFAHEKFPSSHVPTVFENYVKDFDVDDNHVELDLWDTAVGQEDYDRLRPLSYPDTNVLLITFAIDMPDSLENVVEKWVPEVKKFCPYKPFLLIALKQDLRDDPLLLHELKKSNVTPVTAEQGKAVAKQIEAYAYMECSAKIGRGVKEIFQKAVQATMGVPPEAIKKKKRGCVVM